MAHYTVYITRMILPVIHQQLEPLGSIIEWGGETPNPRDELLRHVHRADALLCSADDRIDREVIDAGVHLKVISTMSDSIDHIDLDAAAARGIIVCHAPNAANEAIADLTMGLLLACARKIIEADAFVRQNEWQYWSPDLFLGTDVQGSTIGIIGLTEVGLLIAHRARGFGMRVLYYSEQRNLDAEQRLGIEYGSLDNVLREADFVTLHLWLSPSTFHVINAERLRLMKPSAYLINTSRGGVIDHDALVQALEEGWIAGAGLDVFEQEPIAPDDPLLEMPNVILSPHLGANTRDGILTMTRMAAEQIIDALNGRKPAHQVGGRDQAA